MLVVSRTWVIDKNIQVWPEKGGEKERGGESRKEQDLEMIQIEGWRETALSRGN